MGQVLSVNLFSFSDPFPTDDWVAGSVALVSPLAVLHGVTFKVHF